MLGLFGGLFATDDNDFDRRPNITSQSVCIEIPDNLTPEQKQRVIARVQEDMRLRTMSQRQQLEYFLNKRGR